MNRIRMMKRWIVMAAVLGCSGGLWAGSAQAISIGFNPAATTVNVGEMFNVDVVISGLEAGGLDEIVSAFDLDVGFDAGILTATGVTFTNFLGDPALFEVFQSSDLTTPGVVDFAALSLLSDADLQSLQPDTFTLATLSFEASALGTSTLMFEPDAIFGVDVKGLNAAVLDLTVEDGSVTAVPEPASVLLLGTGIVGLMAYRWRKKVVT